MAVVVTRMPAGTLPPTGWVCSICLDNTPNDLVVHAPPLHPFHRMCLLDWLNETTSCPNCRITLHATGIITPLERCLIASRRALNQIRSRESSQWDGIALMAIGLIAQNAAIAAIGSALVCRAAYRLRRNNPTLLPMRDFIEMMCGGLYLTILLSHKAISPSLEPLTQAVCYTPPPPEPTWWETITSGFTSSPPVHEPVTVGKIASVFCALFPYKAPPPTARFLFFF